MTDYGPIIVASVAVVGVLITSVASIITALISRSTHHAVNSRMDEWMRAWESKTNALKEAAYAAGKEAERTAPESKK